MDHILLSGITTDDKYLCWTVLENPAYWPWMVLDMQNYMPENAICAIIYTQPILQRLSQNGWHKRVPYYCMPNVFLQKIMSKTDQSTAIIYAFLLMCLSSYLTLQYIHLHFVCGILLWAVGEPVTEQLLMISLQHILLLWFMPCYSPHPYLWTCLAEKWSNYFELSTCNSR